MFIVTKRFDFAAAHHLTRYHGKCELPHGHNYILEVAVRGEMADNGMVLDFVLLKQLVNDRIITRVDHHNLNDIFANPTTEHFCKWVWDELSPLAEQLEKYTDNANLPAEISSLQAGDGSAQLDVAGANLQLYSVKIWETANSVIEYRGE